MVNNEYPGKKLTPEEEEYWMKRSAKTPAKPSRNTKNKHNTEESLIDFLRDLFGL